MRKTVLIFGGIAGLITICLGLIHWSLYKNGLLSMDNSELVGYGSMVITLSMVFFGIKSYRDRHLNGRIKFLKGLQVGLLITLMASLVYAATWEIYLLVSEGGQEAFMETYTEVYLGKMKEDGASIEEIEQMTTRLSDMAEMYNNPFLRFGMTLLEILPVGIVITLISAGILRRKEVLPA